ncbi:MAG: DMT family transporter [Pseudomonadota bacterium]
MKKNSNLILLIVLGIIWSTFAIFTKISSENLLPTFVSFARLALGGSMLLALCLFQRKKILMAKNFKHYMLVGFFNSALPFTLFAIAARFLDSGVVSILDGTVPMFEVLISIFILGRLVDKNAVLGVFFGVIGIVITSWGSVTNASMGMKEILSVIAILGATASYAAASLYVNAKCKDIEPILIATGSVLCATLLLSPSLFFTDFSVITPRVALSLLGLGALCTGIAYIFYFRLLAEEGPRAAVSVVLLIPVFGTIFGTIFLGELLTINKVIGCLTILISMKFILNLSRKNFFKSKEAPIV